MKIDTCKDYASSQMSPWLIMDFKNWKNLIEVSEVKTYQRRTVVYQQSDQPAYVYLVKSGRVVLESYSMNGKKRSIYIADKGTCFGELSCLDQLPNYCTAITNVKTELYLISKSRFIQEIHQNHEFCMTLLKTMSFKTRLITSLLELMSFNDSNSRICHSLLSLSQLYGITTEQGYCKINIKFTHQEMAHQAGLSRVSVSNIFLDLTNQGLITKEKGYLIIKDIHALQEYLNRE